MLLLPFMGNFILCLSLSKIIVIYLYLGCNEKQMFYRFMENSCSNMVKSYSNVVNSYSNMANSCSNVVKCYSNVVNEVNKNVCGRRERQSECFKCVRHVNRLLLCCAFIFRLLKLHFSGRRRRRHVLSKKYSTTSAV